MDIVIGKKYTDVFNTAFSITEIQERDRPLADLITAKEINPRISGDPVVWRGTEHLFEKAFVPFQSPEEKGNQYTFNSLDSYTNTELEGIRDGLRDKLSGEILRVQALKAEILFLCKEITKYKNAQ